MKSNPLLIMVGVITLLFGCNTKVSNNIIEDNLNIDTTLVAILQENISYLSQIEDAVMLNDSSFVVISDNKLIKYNLKGKQLDIIGTKGRAQGEYILPKYIISKDSSLYVWCEMQLKLIEYDLNGKFIKEINNYKKAIKGFNIYNDKYAIFYLASSPDNKIIDIYDIKKDSVIEQIGEFSNKDIVCKLMQKKTNLLIEGPYLYFICPSSLNLHNINLDSIPNEKENIIAINDDNFVTESIEDPISLINNNKELLMEYMLNNSLCHTIFKIGEKKLLITEIGKYEKEESSNKILSNKRYYKFYITDVKDDKIITRTKVGNINDFLNNVYINYNNELFTIIYDNEMNELRLYKLSINQK